MYLNICTVCTLILNRKVHYISEQSVPLYYRLTGLVSNVAGIPFMCVYPFFVCDKYLMIRHANVHRIAIFFQFFFSADQVMGPGHGPSQAVTMPQKNMKHNLSIEI